MADVKTSGVDAKLNTSQCGVMKFCTLLDLQKNNNFQQDIVTFQWFYFTMEVYYTQSSILNSWLQSATLLEF
jgi:hypothetical protein